MNMQVAERAPFVAGYGLAHSLGDISALAAAVRTRTQLAANAPVRADTTDLGNFLPKPALRRTPHYARMALLAGLRALDMASWRDSAGLRETALVLGTAHGCAQTSMDFMDSILEGGPGLSSPTAFSHSVGNVAAGLMTILLGIEGPCFTISLFEHSFSGALSTAITLLAAGRVKRVLAGAVDETDARFISCCAKRLNPTPHLPLTEGAVFLCLTNEKNRAALPRIRVCGASAGQADDAGNTLRRNIRFYGQGPLAQALDVLLALEQLGRNNAHAAFRVPPCSLHTPGRGALIELESAP